jgi:hypothetical protein
MSVGRFFNIAATHRLPLTLSPRFFQTRWGWPAVGRKAQGTKETWAMTFGQRHFGGLDLGDARRERRLPELVDAMHKHPGGTLPDKLSEPRELRAFYRMMNAEDVTHPAVLSRHYRVTGEAIAEAAGAGATVLILHDATELDYTSRTTLIDDLGQIGQGTNRGYICHNSLAVRADTKATLGLTSQILHHRADVPKNETAKECRERANRESRLWVKGATQSGPLPVGRVVDVSDTLSDTFEYMAYEIDAGRQFVLRSKENRKLVEPINGEHYLHDAVRTKRSVLEWDHAIPAKPGRKARTAHLKMSYTAVVLNLPGKRAGDYAKRPLTLWAVRVWEANPPAGEEALEWILLTNVPVNTPEEARERVAWYECRFVIEEYHKGMKTGCGIELLQFTTIDGLEPVIGVLSVLTTTLLNLRDAARAPDADTRPASDVVNQEYIDVLVRHYSTRLSGFVSVKAFYMHVARLGGHQNRKCDGFPGWLTLWRGWMKLESMALGYRLAKRKQQSTCGKT